MTDNGAARERYEAHRQVVLGPVSAAVGGNDHAVRDANHNTIATCTSAAVAETIAWYINRGRQRLHHGERQTLDELLAEEGEIS